MIKSLLMFGYQRNTYVDGGDVHLDIGLLDMGVTEAALGPGGTFEHELSWTDCWVVGRYRSTIGQIR
jgi:hypothetical protein